MKLQVLRRCAQTLHSLCPTDRRRLLAELPSEHARDLDGMLAELDSVHVCPEFASGHCADRQPARPVRWWNAPGHAWRNASALIHRLLA
jgi:hypothetical protein